MTLRNFARVRIDDRLVKPGVIVGDSVIIDGTSYPGSDVEFLAPVTPSQLVCVGLNYQDHAEEMKMELPSEPPLFLKPPSSMLRHGEPIRRRPEVERLDYEGELAVVIGRRARNVPTADAMLIRHISSFMTLEVGDLILTGTPSGVGPMSAGDIVEVAIDGLGTLSNAVVDD